MPKLKERLNDRAKALVAKKQRENKITSIYLYETDKEEIRKLSEAYGLTLAETLGLILDAFNEED